MGGMNEPTDYDRALALYIRGILGWHGLKQSDLARILGCSQQNASQKLSGERRFSLLDVKTLAVEFDIEPGLLLNPPRFERGLLTCTFNALPQVSGLSGSLCGWPAKTARFPSPRAA